MDSVRRQQIEAFANSVGFPILEREADLVDQALTHPSWAFEAETDRDNQRLEFLGDAVIGLVITQAVYEEFRHFDEGRLSKAKAAAVSRRTLGLCAQKIELGPVILYGRGEARSGGSTRLSNLGAALEALVGAFYLLRGFDASAEWVRIKLLPYARQVMFTAAEEDCKSRLQEWTQAHIGVLPKYAKVDEQGPDHCKTFAVEVHIEGVCRGRGVGPRLKDAQNSAAREALDFLTGGGANE